VKNKATQSVIFLNCYHRFSLHGHHLYQELYWDISRIAKYDHSSKLLCLQGNNLA